MVNNYDKVAGSYDKLSKLVFGKSLVRSQQVLLPFLKAPARILIVGGGTGWILEEIAKVQPAGLMITYVEISEKMLALARERDYKRNRVTFVHSAIEDYAASQQFDVVMTPFLFDNFSTERASIVFDRLNQMLAAGGNWLFTDFRIEKNIRGIWQTIVLKSMYLFFKILCKVEASELPDMAPVFQNAGYVAIEKHAHFHGFIQSLNYRKLKLMQPAFSQK